MGKEESFELAYERIYEEVLRELLASSTLLSSSGQRYVAVGIFLRTSE